MIKLIYHDNYRLTLSGETETRSRQDRVKIETRHSVRTQVRQSKTESETKREMESKTES